MASEKLFDGIAPFPDDIPTAPLYTIPLADLRSGDEATAQTVLSACQELGFFLLDLRGDDLGDRLVEEIDQIFNVGKDLLGLPQDVKEQYLHDAPRSFLGFKPRGQAKIETSEPDRFEWFNIGQDGLMGTGALQSLPPLVHENLSLFTSFLNYGQSIIDIIGSTLAMQLGLPRDAFTSLQQPTKPSGTIVRFIKSLASPKAEDLRTSMIHHTDFGSITLLANVIGGLQILSPGRRPEDKSAWLWVRPQPGCLVVNLGDAMPQWTGGLLRSNVHRVNYAPGDQRFSDRYSLALLVRPERDASMRKLTGPGEDGEDGKLTAWEWEVKKTMSLVHGDAVMRSKSGESMTIKT